MCYSVKCVEIVINCYQFAIECGQVGKCITSVCNNTVNNCIIKLQNFKLNKTL